MSLVTEVTLGTSVLRGYDGFGKLHTSIPDSEPKVILKATEDIDKLLNAKYETLRAMVRGVAMKQINGLLIRGSAGVGKTYTVQEILDELSKTHPDIKPKWFRGRVTAVQFYLTLAEHRTSKDLLVFDDCDSILQDSNSLEVIKAAMDTQKIRHVSWKNGTVDPSEFDFDGNLIIITNTEPYNNEDYKAVLDRILSIDFWLTPQEKLIRINQLATALVNSNKLTPELKSDITNWMKNNPMLTDDKLSLRTFVKLMDLAKLSPDKWREYARLTIIR